MNNDPAIKISRRQQILECLAQMLEESPGARITTAALAKKVGVNNTFKHAGYIYQVVNSDVNTPRTIGRTGNKRFNVTNAVRSDRNMPRKRLYLVEVHAIWCCYFRFTSPRKPSCSNNDC
jgi:hypothetical protein